MRTGFDAKRAFYNFSGLGNYSRNIISLLNRFYPDDDQVLYTPGTGEVRPGFPPPGACVKIPQGFLANTFKSYWRSVGLTKQLENDGIEIYHGLSNELPAGIQHQKVASVVTVHDLIFIRFPELYHRIDRNIYRKKITHALKSASRIVAISEQTKRDIIEYTGTPATKINVVYQSCNPSFIPESSPHIREAVKLKYDLPDTYLLYVGTIEKRKNLLTIVRALHQGRIGLPLVVIGRETSYAALVHDYITKYQVPGIRFLKNVPNTDLPPIYQQAMLFIYPSSFEGFGIPVLEALNSGVPVIAGKGSCLEETGGPHSVYVDPLDTDNMAHEIKRLSGDEPLRRKMVEKGKQFAVQFSEENTTRTLHELYESLL
ncbi:MAG TPA: glycosyltransferase family 1 protein [Bacteroidales bacterium]|nr:glycosyltransferase family 1 protein [Bacteroidales bacterium]